MPKKKHKYTVKELAVLEQINLNAAGIDIGHETNYVAVPAGRSEESVREFGTFTPDIEGLIKWLQKCKVDTVAMESTGVYWIPLYEMLESAGFEVYLVNARHVKNVTGRKSDILDCQWLQQLHTYGLLRASFRPEEQIVALRAVVRQRKMLIQYRAAHIQHMQKALQLMNIQLTQVLSDIVGVTGMKIIRAIIAGEQSPQKLASYRNGQCKHSEEDIAKALTGNYRQEHLFALKQAVELFDFYGQQLAACDEQLEGMYQQFEAAIQPAAPLLSKKKRRRKNQPHFDLQKMLYRLVGVDLTEVDGFDTLVVQTLVSEIGTNVEAWPSVKHFTSWLGLSPNNRITGGKVIGRRTKKTSNRANTAFRVAAQSVARSNSAVGAFYRRKRAHLGPAKAIVATAHKLARIFYVMLKRREPYQDPGATYYEEQYRQRTIRNLQRKAAKLGLQLEPLTTSVEAGVS